MEGAMFKADLWNKSVPRVELDQRARDARLRLERIGRQLVPRAAPTRSPRRRLLYLFTGGLFVSASRESRTRGPLSSRRPRLPQIQEVWLEVRGSSCRTSDLSFLPPLRRIRSRRRATPGAVAERLSCDQASRRIRAISSTGTP